MVGELSDGAIIDAPARPHLRLVQISLDSASCRSSKAASAPSLAASLVRSLSHAVLCLSNRQGSRPSQSANQSGLDRRKIRWRRSRHRPTSSYLSSASIKVAVAAPAMPVCPGNLDVVQRRRRRGEVESNSTSLVSKLKSQVSQGCCNCDLRRLVDDSE